MKHRWVGVFFSLLCLMAPALAQDQGGARGRGGFGGAGLGLMGTVTTVADGSITLTNYLGQSYTVRYNAATRFLRQAIDERSRPGSESASPAAMPPRPEEVQISAIKPGVDIAVTGVVDTASKSASANTIVLVDAERARLMRERMASYGKTWLMGKVVSVEGLKILITGTADGVSYTVLLDDNTSLRKRREPATLAEVAAGDTLRVEGKAAEGGFVATTIDVMGAMPPHGGPVLPRAPQQ